jgi:hypothetical protein
MKTINRNKYTWIALVVMAIIAVVIGFIFPISEKEGGLSWTNFDGFYALLGFIGCVAMIYLAKWLDRYWLQRKDNYYD